jgi:hypothetical protein
MIVMVRATPCVPRISPHDVRCSRRVYCRTPRRRYLCLCRCCCYLWLRLTHRLCRNGTAHCVGPLRRTTRVSVFPRLEFSEY